MRTRPARRPTAEPWTHLFTARSTTSGWWPAPEPPRTFFDWRTHLKIGKATVPRSAICTSSENTIVVRGADLAHELIGQINFGDRSEEHTSELQSLMRISYAVFCLQKKKHNSHLP